MKEISINKDTSKEEFYDNLITGVRSLISGENDSLANLCNIAALIYHSLPDINWAGFYLLKNNELVLGPFQGKPACVRIKPGKGVCGTACEREETIVVNNVHQFPGHIACDSVSNSEIVIPIKIGNKVVGVLDIDSPEFSRFDEKDKIGLESVVIEVANILDNYFLISLDK